MALLLLAYCCTTALLLLYYSLLLLRYMRAQVMPHLDAARRGMSAAFLNGSQVLLQRLARQHVAANCQPGKALAFDYNDQGLAAVVSDASVQLTWAFRQAKPKFT